MKFIIVILSFLIITNSYLFGNNHRLLVNSSYNKQVISLSISTSATKSFIINSPTFIPQTTVTLLQTHLEFEPQLKDMLVIYNDITDGQNWIGLKSQYKIKQQDMDDSHFLPIKVKSANEQEIFLMPLFKTPMSFLLVNNLYKCDNVLFFVDTSKGLLDVTLFSRNHYWQVKSQEEPFYDMQNNLAGTNYGRFVWLHPEVTFQILIENQKHCVMTKQDVKKNDRQAFNSLQLKPLSLQYLQSFNIMEIPAFFINENDNDEL